MTGDEEERVVDADAESQHRRQGRRGPRHLGDVLQQGDHAERGGQSGDRGDDRQAHGHDGSERQQQHDDRHREPDDLARLGARLRQLLAEVAACLDLEARLPGRIGKREELVRSVDGQVARRDAERERDVSRLRVLAEERFALWGQRTDRGGDVGIGRVGLRRLGDGTGVPTVRELSRASVENQRQRTVRAVRETIGQRLRGPVAVRAGELQVVVRVLARVLCKRDEHSHDHEPGGDHGPAEARAESTQRVESLGHDRKLL